MPAGKAGLREGGGDAVACTSSLAAGRPADQGGCRKPWPSTLAPRLSTDSESVLRPRRPTESCAPQHTPGSVAAAWEAVLSPQASGRPITLRKARFPPSPAGAMGPHPLRSPMPWTAGGSVASPEAVMVKAASQLLSPPSSGAVGVTWRVCEGGSMSRRGQDCRGGGAAGACACADHWACLPLTGRSSVLSKDVGHDGEVHHAEPRLPPIGCTGRVRRESLTMLQRLSIDIRTPEGSLGF